MINVLDEQINKLAFGGKEYPIEENMYIKIGNHKIKGMNNIKSFLEGVLSTMAKYNCEIGYDEKNRRFSCGKHTKNC